MGILKKLRGAVKGAKASSPVAPPVDSSTTVDVSPIREQGTLVEITRGEAHQDTQGLDGSPGGGSTRLAGAKVRVDGNAYIAKAGPNKGKLCQQVKDPTTGRLYAVPTDKLRGVQGGRRGASVGWTPGYDEAWERVFGKDKERS